MRKFGSVQAIKATIRARGSGIAKPAIKYHGLKFQFRVFDHMTGMARNPNTATVKYGTFPWRTLDVFAVVVSGSDAKLRELVVVAELPVIAVAVGIVKRGRGAPVVIDGPSR
jgi:hypothetical protein